MFSRNDYFRNLKRIMEFIITSSNYCHSPFQSWALIYEFIKIVLFCLSSKKRSWYNGADVTRSVLALHNQDIILNFLFFVRVSITIFFWIRKSAMSLSSCTFDFRSTSISFKEIVYISSLFFLIVDLLLQESFSISHRSSFKKPLVNLPSPLLYIF